MSHVISIVIDDDGKVSGDVTTFPEEHERSLWPAADSEGEATTIDGQARSILQQALEIVLLDQLKLNESTR